jgi:hypothetical protein
MANSKFLKIAVAGVAVAAIAIGVGVGFGVNNKKSKDASASSSANSQSNCRRLLVVPGIEDNVADAPSIRRKLLARRLGAEGSSNDTDSPLVETYEEPSSWGGDAYPTPAPANSYASTKTSSGVTSKGTNSKGKSSTLSKGKSSPKGGSKKSKSSTTMPVRYFGISVCLRLVFTLLF